MFGGSAFGSAFGSAVPASSSSQSNTSAFGAPIASTSSSRSSASTLFDPLARMFADLAPKLEALPPVVKTAYENDEFEWNKVPGIEPPVELR